MSLWYKTKSERFPLELEKGLDLLLCWFNQVRRPAEKFEYNKDKKEITIRSEEITFQKIKAITLKLRVISLLSFIYNKASVSLCVCSACLSFIILLPRSGLLSGPAMWSHRHSFSHMENYHYLVFSPVWGYKRTEDWLPLFPHLGPGAWLRVVLSSLPRSVPALSACFSLCTLFKLSALSFVSDTVE